MHPFLYTLVLLFMALSYYQMAIWKFAVVTALIFFIFSRYQKSNFRERLGLDFKMEQLPWFFVISILFAIITESVIQNKLQNTGITKESPFVLGVWFLQPFCQTLNEEMIARSLFFSFLAQKIRLRWLQSFCMAITFTSAHYFFGHFLLKVDLTLLSSATLFFSTLGMNILFFKFGNILFTWAIHFGVNFSLFGGNYLFANRTSLNDTDKLNLFLGAPGVAIASAVGFILICFFSRSNGFSLNSLQKT